MRNSEGGMMHKRAIASDAGREAGRGSRTKDESRKTRADPYRPGVFQEGIAPLGRFN